MHIAAWAVPVLVVGDFALLATAPVLVLLIGGFTSRRGRYMRWWVSALAIIYAIPLVQYLTDRDAQSLSKDLSATWFVLITVAAGAALVRFYLGDRGGRRR